MIHSNALPQLCRHRYMGQVLKDHSRPPDNLFPFRELIDSREPASNLPPKADGSHAISTYRSQNSITNDAGFTAVLHTPEFLTVCLSEPLMQ